MAGGRQKLTATAVDKRRKPGRVGDGGNLYLNVTNSGSKSWVFRWHPSGKTPEGKQRSAREIGLGPYPEISLARARELALDCRRHLKEGRDPLTERNKATGKTFGECADDYYREKQSDWSNEKSKWQWDRTLKVTCAPIRNRPVSEISTEDVLSVLKPIWETTPETARRTRMRIESVLSFATSKDLRTGENPARWRGHLKNLLTRTEKKKQNYPAMHYDDVPGFFARLEETPGLSAKALRLLILTACRTSEVLHAKWSELDLEKAVWTIPGSRMKAGNEHTVPLSAPAVALLQELQEVSWSDWVFPGNKHRKPLSNMVLPMQMRRMGITDAVPHGFRSSFRDWCGDKTHYPREVAEAALAHTVKGVEGDYRRLTAFEKRRALMSDWAAYCTASQVIPFKVVDGGR